MEHCSQCDREIYTGHCDFCDLDINLPSKERMQCETPGCENVGRFAVIGTGLSRFHCMRCYEGHERPYHKSHEDLMIELKQLEKEVKS